MQFQLRTFLAAVSVKKLAVAVIRTFGRQGSTCTSLMTTCNYCLDDVNFRGEFFKGIDRKRENKYPRTGISNAKLLVRFPGIENANIRTQEHFCWGLWSQIVKIWTRENSRYTVLHTIPTNLYCFSSLRCCALDFRLKLLTNIRLRR